MLLMTFQPLEYLKRWPEKRWIPGRGVHQAHEEVEYCKDVPAEKPGGPRGSTADRPSGASQQQEMIRQICNLDLGTLPNIYLAAIPLAS